MPHRQPIDLLRDGLRQVLSLRSSDTAQHWGNPKAMHEMLLSIKRDLAGQADTRPPEDQVKASLLQFHKTRELPSFNNLKYVCYGITVPIGLRQLRVIDDQSLFDSLLIEVGKRQSQAKQFRRCYQGLLDSYFSFDRNGQNSNFTQSNWNGLKGFLANNLSPVLEVSKTWGEPPIWLTTLAEHQNLLGEDPCSRYAVEFMHDDTSQFRLVCAALGISSNSWVWEDALMAYVRSVCNSQEETFKLRLPNLLELVNGRLDMLLPKLLVTQATGMLVSRYAGCAIKPENADLRDTSLKWIGNPWLKRTAWDSVVKNESARQMVESWLKRRLIKDFFEVLAEDSEVDMRRLHYWLKWETHIHDMWFVLGSDAVENRSSQFIGLRKRMEGRDRILSDINPFNNAFIMRIGQLIVIEFGSTGNACFVFATSDFKADLNKRELTIHELKQRLNPNRLKLSHQGRWEFNFDQNLQHLLRTVPLERGEFSYELRNSKNYESSHSISPRSVEYSKVGAQAKNKLSSQKINSLNPAEFQFVKNLSTVPGIELEDNRETGGAFWVLMSDRSNFPQESDILEKIGFHYREGQGFWFK